MPNLRITLKLFLVQKCEFVVLHRFFILLAHCPLFISWQQRYRGVRTRYVTGARRSEKLRTPTVAQDKIYDNTGGVIKATRSSEKI